MNKYLLLFLFTFCTLFSWAEGIGSFADDFDNQKTFLHGTEKGSKLTIHGDVNGDGVVDVSDITDVAKIILGGGEIVVDICPDDQHPHMIDLGLPSGTMWCCCNVDAKMPEDNGGYFAWGETRVKNVFNNDTYGCTNISLDIAGTQYDVARVHMGDSWRMPSNEQFEELLNNCVQEWTQLNGVNGIMLTGKNGNHIFLPAAGYRLNNENDYVGLHGYYWSSSLNPKDNDLAYCINFDSRLLGMNSESRSYGQSVRAVCGSSGVTVALDTIEVSTNSATLKIALEGELENIKELRVYYTKDQISEPNIDNCEYKSIDYSLKQGTTNDTINFVLDGLQDNTTYYSFVYVKTEDDSVYNSNVSSFTTDPISGVEITILDTVKVTTDSATLKIALKGELETIDDVRVYYTKDQISEPSIDNCKFKSIVYSLKQEITNDTIECILDSLQDNTTYYSFVYVKTKDSIYYSNVTHFTTAVRVISGVEINILDPDEITKESATLKFALEGELGKIASINFYFTEDSITEANIDSCKSMNIEYTPTQGVTKDTINCVLDSLKNITTYYYVIHVITNDSTYCSDVSSFRTLSKYKTPKDEEAVDLGLSVKWAPYNMGAEKIESYGGLYGWGDPTGDLTSFDLSCYGPPVLEPSTNIANTEYDIAHVQWGSHWRLPTEKEIQELFDQCEHIYSPKYNNSEVDGYVFKKNSHEIFIPLAGSREGEKTKDEKKFIWLWTCDINSDGVPVAIASTGNGYNSNGQNRSFGLSIRPVYDENPYPIDPIDPVDPVDPEPEDSLYANAVDLGLSVLWADKNIGADDSNPYGNFYRWGETDTNNTTSYDPQDYKYCADKVDEYKWRYTYIGSSISGNPEYDAATANWGKRWRMPTEGEINEMIENCDITLDNQNGIDGYTVKSRTNGKSIFLPAAGYKYGKESYGKMEKIASYWSGTSYDFNPDTTHEPYYDKCYILSIEDNSEHIALTDYRYFGRLIRPVRDK